MEAIKRELIMQRWNVIQYERLPELRNDVGALTPKLEKVIPTLEGVRHRGVCGLGLWPRRGVEKVVRRMSGPGGRTRFSPSPYWGWQQRRG